MKAEISDINDDTGLTAFITEQDVESELSSTKVEKNKIEKFGHFCKM